MTTNVNLATLNPSQGVIINGTSKYSDSAYYVSGAGDVNNDGYADVIIGVLAANNYTGEVYVIYGGSSLNSTINLGDLGTQGINIYGTMKGSYIGYSISGAGDVNKDGYADIIIGAPGIYYNYTTPCTAGISYVIYGSSSLTNINLASLTSSQGFSIAGVSKSCSGYSVSGAGDVNGDGYADVIIGAPGCTPWQCDVPGSSYVIYGSSSSSAINLATLNTAQGFKISGAQLTSEMGFAVSGAGDINNDGYDDVIISAPFENQDNIQCFIVYGRANPPLTIDINNLGSQGVTVNAPGLYYTYTAVGEAGDVNKDGYDDVIIGFTQVNTYIIYGNKSIPNTIDLAKLGSQGILIDGFSNCGGGQESVSGAGDINGDGYDDTIIGSATYCNSNGREPSAYVIDGSQFLPSTINVAGLEYQGDSITGSGSSTSGAGDVNGDGYDDVIIGAEGKSYILYGTTTGFIGSPTLNPTKAPVYSDDNNNNKQSNSLSGGAIAGIVIGSLVGVACLLGRGGSSSQAAAPAPVWRKVAEIWERVFFSSEVTVVHKSQYDWIINHQKLLNLTEGKNLYISEVLSQHTYSPYYPANELYEQLLKENDLFYLILNKASKLFLNDYNDNFIVFDKFISSSYNIKGKFIAVRSDINSTYINTKSIFMHELIHMIFDDITNDISQKILAEVHEGTVHSLLNYVAKLMEVESNDDINILITNLKDSEVLDLFYLKSAVQYTVQHKNDDTLIKHLAELLDTNIQNEEELVNAYIPQMIVEYNLSTEQVYFLERMADYLKGVDKGVYPEGAEGCEEIAARCIEFRAAGVSNEILELCKPIEDIMMLGVSSLDVASN